MAINYSPLPWRVELPTLGHVEMDRCGGITDAKGYPVVTTDSGVYDPDLVTALFIVRACNAHDRLTAVNAELLAALTTILRGFDLGIFCRDVTHDGESDWAIRLFPYIKALADANAIITKAEAE